MQTVTLGKTSLVVNKNGFGALPIQRISLSSAQALLQSAYENGITFFDTARAYTDSEHKIGVALNAVRKKIVIASKTMHVTVSGFWEDLHTSLKALQTDYIDIYQFHNPDFCPKPNDGTGLYEAMQEAKKSGLIRFIGLTNHRLNIALEAVDSGLYDTLQFPFSYLSTEADIALVQKCRNHNVAFFAMKALSGGLITNASAAYQFMLEYDNVLPLWGIQRQSELDDFIACQKGALCADIDQVIANDRKALAGSFCRGCGYCMPCPVGIEINYCARMSQLIRRSPSQGHLTAEAQAKMQHINECLHCGQCTAKCPYALDTPALLKQNLLDYQEILAGKAL